MPGDLATDLVAVAHRVPPVQAGPHPGVVDVAHERVQVVIGALGPNYLGDGRRAGLDGPGDAICAEELTHRISYGGRPEAVCRGVLGVVHRQQWYPRGIGVGVRIAIAAGSR